ncbi:DUF2971 domain-containing protein [Vallitalea guaymasensis]|uniref:DUF2971 domain-containing protein n=1 Tax=Vallitalea guaymasensis TaxID=1185412 RepID=UPI002353878A|nr:DUF2971 domain-containing protein [Vallitalea guaymasensis]
MIKDKGLLNKYYNEIKKYLRNIFDTSYVGSLYHYTRKEAVISILDSQILIITNLANMNDPSEWMYGLTLIIQELQSTEYDKKTVNLLNKKIEKCKKEIETVYVFSCSKKKDNKFLWDNYAKDDGYALEFRSIILNDKLNDILIEEENNYILPCSVFVDSGKVIYDSKKQKEIVKYLLCTIDEYIKNETSSEQSLINSKFLVAEIFEICALFKKEKYKDEDEYRMIFYNYKSLKEDKLIVNFAKKNKRIPINKIIYNKLEKNVLLNDQKKERDNYKNLTFEKLSFNKN